MNWPQIPETFEGMDSTALRALAAEIKAARKPNLAAAKTPEDMAEYDRITKVELARVEAAAAVAESDEAEAAAEAQRQADEAAAAQAAADAAAAGPDDGNDTSSGEGGDNDASQKLPTGLSLATDTKIEKDPIKTTAPASSWQSTGIAEAGPGRGKNFESNQQLARAVMELGAAVVNGDGSREHVIARQPFRFQPGTDLHPDKPFMNAAKFADPDEITAAFCPPPQPLYDLACDNSARRPVLMGLPAFRSPERGAFTVMESPSLSDIVDGYGRWTSADDSNVNAVKDCAVVECVDTNTYEIYSTYRCLIVKNQMQMFFPELVAAYQNRLAAAHARYAETLLLEAMGTASTQIDAPALGYNAATNLGSAILGYLGLYAEIERWDATVMDAWMPRWVLWAMKTDLLRRRRTDGGRNLVASDAEIENIFRDAGVEPHWFMDRPSWAVPVPNLATSRVLNFYPSSVQILVHRRGKFALMARDGLNIGVSGNNTYRVDDDLLRNQFRYFFESWEGVIDTDSCPAHILDVPVCWNGVQIADELLGCSGENIAGGVNS